MLGLAVPLLIISLYLFSGMRADRKELGGNVRYSCHLAGQRVSLRPGMQVSALELMGLLNVENGIKVQN
jgi:hypothetical protein